MLPGAAALAFIIEVASLALPAMAEVKSAPVVTDRTRATLVTKMDAAVPGASLPVALRLQLKPGWHTYWRNPGDSGEPAVVTLHVGGRAYKGPSAWPVPERIEMSGIVSYGHHDEVFLITNVAVPPTTGPMLSVEAEATWLVCEKVCVPEQGQFMLNLPVVAKSSPNSSSHLKSLLPVAGEFARTADGWTLRVPAGAQSTDGAVVDAYFFPERGDVIDHSAPQVLRTVEGGILLGMTASAASAAPPTELRGVLAVTRQRPDGARQTYYARVTAQPTTQHR